MYHNGHFGFSKVSKVCTIHESSSNEGGDIKGIQVWSHRSCYSDDAGGMSNGKVVRVETIEPVVVRPKLEQLRVFHSETYIGHLCSTWCLSSQNICLIATLGEVYLRFWRGCGSHCGNCTELGEKM